MLFYSTCPELILKLTGLKINVKLSCLQSNLSFWSGVFLHIFSVFFPPSPLFFWRSVCYVLWRSFIHSNALSKLGKRRHELPAVTAHRGCALVVPWSSSFISPGCTVLAPNYQIVSFRAVRLGAFLYSDFTFQFSELLSTPKSQPGVRKRRACSVLRRWNASVSCSGKCCIRL